MVRASDKCTGRLQWVEGCKLQECAGLRLRPHDVSMLLLKSFAEQAFVHGFVHADPHAGNLLLRPHPRPSLSFP